MGTTGSQAKEMQHERADWLPSPDDVYRVTGGAWRASGHPLHVGKGDGSDPRTVVFQAKPGKSLKRGAETEGGTAAHWVIKMGWCGFINRERSRLELMDARNAHHSALPSHPEGTSDMWYAQSVPESVACVVTQAAAYTWRRCRVVRDYEPTCVPDCRGGAGAAGHSGVKLMTMSQLRLAAMRLVDGLQVLHSKAGIVHFDVAPSNIGVRPGENITDVFLFDLDASQVVLGCDGTFGALPSPPTRILYASIGTHRGRAVHPIDDLEQLGYVLLELVLGTLPWAETALAATTELDSRAADLADADSNLLILAHKQQLLEAPPQSGAEWLHEYLSIVRDFDDSHRQRRTIEAPYDALRKVLRKGLSH